MGFSNVNGGDEGEQSENEEEKRPGLYRVTHNRFF